MRSSHPPHPLRRRLDRLSAADLSNLVFEHGPQVYTVAMVGVLEAGPLVDAQGRPDVVRLRRVLAPRVAAIPQLNRRVHPTRRGQGLPVWLSCPADLAVHVRPGAVLDGEAALVGLCQELVSRPVPRDRPLWDLMLCAGPGEGRATVGLRLHHALADGVTGVGIMRGLFDPDDRSTPVDGAAPQSVSRANEPDPTGRELRLDAARGWGRRTVSALGHPGRWSAWLQLMARGAVRTVVIARGGMPPTSLLGPIGAGRTVRVVTADLDQVRAAGHAVGGTVNDVLLGAVARAVVALLDRRGERVPEYLPVSVPVSLRDENGFGTTGNEVGVMLVRLPLLLGPSSQPDPRAPVRRIAAVTRRAKVQARRAGSLELTRSRLGIKVMDLFSRRQRAVGMFVTNVPGPASELTLDGARLLRAVPLGIIAGDIRISVAALSYAGVITVTTTFDADSCPDADVFADALSAGLRLTCSGGSGADASTRAER